MYIFFIIYYFRTNWWQISGNKMNKLKLKMMQKQKSDDCGLVVLIISRLGLLNRQ